MTTEDLSQLGLSPKEAALYLYCVEHGPSRAKDIALATELNRGTTYDVARDLIKKGLVSTTQKQNVTHFVAQSPSRYMRLLNQELATAAALLPSIELLLSSSQHRPTLRYFEGNEGIRQAYEETLKCKKKEIVSFLSVEEIVEAVGADFLTYYIKKRVRRHIKLRCLKDPLGEIKEPVAEYTSGSDPKLLRETRFSPGSIDIAGNCVMFDDCVALMSTKKENFAVILRSSEFATMFKQMFETIWKMQEDLPAA